MSNSKSLFQNKLLNKLAPESLALLGEMEQVELALRQTVDRKGEPVEWVYFVESGLVSVVEEVKGMGSIEVGMIGREGFGGISVVLEDGQASFDSFIQGEGAAFRVKAVVVRKAVEQNAELRRILVRYARCFSIQVATTAFANGHAKLESRLARWLLMVADRLGHTFHVTHEFLALMLAVRRSGVTLGLHILEGKGLIRATRGTITITDRDGLVEHASGTYGYAEAEYRRLLD